MAFLGRFDAPDAPGCDSVAPRRRLAWRILVALALIAIALLFGHRAEAQAPPPRGAGDILQELKLKGAGGPSPARRAESAKALAAEPEPADAASDVRVPFLLRRAAARGLLAQRDLQKADLLRALELAGANARQRYAALGALYSYEAEGGSLLDAREHANAQVETGKTLPAAFHVAAMHRQVYIAFRVGDRPLVERSMAELDYTIGRLRRGAGWQRSGDQWTSLQERSRSLMHALRGDLSAAEQSAQTALAAAERVLAARVDAAAEGERDDTAGRTAWIEAVTRSLATYQASQGKLLAAELAARKALQLTLDRAGFASGATARSLQLLARVLIEQGRYAAAEQIARQSIAAADAAGLSPASEVFAFARAALGAALAMQGHWGESARVFAERVEILGKADPALRKSLRLGDFNWALALIKTGQHERARNLLAAMRKSFENYGEGAGASRLAYTRGLAGLSYVEQGQVEQALVEFRASVPVILEHAFVDQREERDGPARLARMNHILEGYLKALSPPGRATPAPDAVAEMFRIADFARASRVQRALSLGSARAAARDPALKKLVEEDERLVERLTVLSGVMGDLSAATDGKRLDQVIGQMRGDLGEIDRQRDEIRKRIAADFADFADLVSPRPVAIEDARKALRPGEALLSIYVAEDRAYIWGIGPGREPAFAVADAKRADIAEHVGNLRRALDVGDRPLQAFPVYDVALAHRLYTLVVQPVEAALAGAKTLLVAPHGALGQLPFALLVTAPTVLTPGALRFEEYRAVPWLAKKFAIVQIPAVSSLVTLSRLPAPRAGRKAFIGYGDPQFSLTPAPAGATRGAMLRDLTVSRGETSAGLSKLPALPDTREELREIARVLGADLDKDVFLGTAASERNVDDAHLAGRRVIAFATHGLVAGDLDGLTQPALALASPEGNNARGDGLLTMEEILGLRMDADWVVLSACNTAAAGGAGDEAVSGLGRAFFFAGARAILVSNWPVETVSARLLTTGLFQRQAANPKLTRAEALRQSMLELLERGATPQYAYAHPMFWAPFSLVGDGN